MKKHLLVTISSDVHNLYGIHFLNSFFKKMTDHQVTLLHINRIEASEMNKALTEMWEDPDEIIDDKITMATKRAIAKAKEILGQSKMSIDLIKTKTVKERYGKVKDILTIGEEGLYDAIVLGKRASYTLQWIFEKPGEETALAMVRDSGFTTPLWICPEIKAGRKNVLVGLDGSKNSFRTVDHVGYMLSLQEQHGITLLHVDVGSGIDCDAMFNKARSILHEHGIKDERITTKSTWSFTVAGTIISEADRGGYSAVAVGHHGYDQSLLKEYNLGGGTTKRLISKLECSSLWCCP